LGSLVVTPHKAAASVAATPVGTVRLTTRLRTVVVGVTALTAPYPIVGIAVAVGVAIAPGNAILAARLMFLYVFAKFETLFFKSNKH